jgi:hypothetical protein
MAETADLLLLVEPVGGHLHAAVCYVRACAGELVGWKNSYRTATMS